MSWFFGTNVYEFASFDELSELLTLQKQIMPGFLERLFGKSEKTKFIKFRKIHNAWYTYPELKPVPEFKNKILFWYLKIWEKEHGRS